MPDPDIFEVLKKIQVGVVFIYLFIFKFQALQMINVYHCSETITATGAAIFVTSRICACLPAAKYHLRPCALTL